MKKFIVIGSVVLALGLLSAGLALPSLAHGPTDADTPVNQEAWEAMHEACEEGDWEAMAEAAEEVHGDDFAAMPCHGEGAYSSGGEGRVPSGRWGGGMMGNGMMGGGMMRW